MLRSRISTTGKQNSIHRYIYLLFPMSVLGFPVTCHMTGWHWVEPGVDSRKVSWFSHECRQNKSRGRLSGHISGCHNLWLSRASEDWANLFWELISSQIYLHSDTLGHNNTFNESKSLCSHDSPLHVQRGVRGLVVVVGGSLLVTLGATRAAQIIEIRPQQKERAVRPAAHSSFTGRNLHSVVGARDGFLPARSARRARHCSRVFPREMPLVHSHAGLWLGAGGIFFKIIQIIFHHHLKLYVYWSCCHFQFADGVWYVTQKFATKSTCLTYEFTTDELGFKEITQVGHLRKIASVNIIILSWDSCLTVRRWAWTTSTSKKDILNMTILREPLLCSFEDILIDGHIFDGFLLCRYTGKLYAANEDLPAKMNVRFPLSKIVIILTLIIVKMDKIIIIILLQTQSERQALWCWTLTTRATASSARARRSTSSLPR